MDVRTIAVRLILLTLFTAGWISCGENEPAGEPVAMRAAEQVRNIGDTTAAQLTGELKNALLAAMQDGGPVSAVAVCQTKALPLTRQVAIAGGRKVLSVKRTSFRFRNPLNAPDSVDSLALRHFESLHQSPGDTIPAYHIRKIRGANQPLYYYYQPLMTAGLCLTCHGDTATMPSALRDTLAVLYPADRATGYEEGDFRGLIRVAVGLPAQVESQKR